MDKRVPGKAEFRSVHDGRLFLFPSEKQQKMFERNPRKYTEADLALDGKCPVCLVKMDKVVDGRPEYATIHDGLRYLFPGPEQQRMFEKNPTAFTPALGGDCTVCRVEMEKSVPGKAAFHTVYKDRLYVFPSRKQLDMFSANPQKYAKADLALDGRCVVCKVDMNKDVPGKESIAVDYQGRRYLFPDDKTRDKFLANPTRYVRN